MSFDWKISLTSCFISQRKLLWLIDRGNIGREIKTWKMLLNRNSSAPLNHVSFPFCGYIECRPVIGSFSRGNSRKFS